MFSKEIETTQQSLFTATMARAPTIGTTKTNISQKNATRGPGLAAKPIAGHRAAHSSVQVKMSAASNNDASISVSMPTSQNVSASAKRAAPVAQDQNMKFEKAADVPAATSNRYQEIKFSSNNGGFKQQAKEVKFKPHIASW